jgi:hypothetical protein
MQSKTYSLNKEDGLKILRGAGYAMGGVLCTYILELLPFIDFGTYTMLVVGIMSTLLNAGVKFFKGE